MPDATYHGYRGVLLNRLAFLPAILSGRVPGHIRASTAIAKAIGVEALACIKEDFIAKGRGSSGVDGVTWEPLSERYIAYHRRHKGLAAKRTRAAKKGRERRPLLSEAQDKLWRGVYASCLRRGDDSGTAAAKAWGTVKRAGGKTIIGEYGKATTEIGRDTGRLLASLSPGDAQNILEAQAGSVRVGTNVKYAAYFAARRPIFPANGTMPQPWQNRIRAVIEAALPALVREIMRG